MKKKMRIAIIGCGAIAGNHVKGVLASGQELCALCDVDPAQSARILEKYELGSLPTYTDYRQMLDRERPDVVHVCTPHHLHAEMCIEALARQIHVLCEKPLAISMEQLAAIEKAAKESRAQLGVCLQNRYEPNILHARKLALETGIRAAYGDVVWNRDAAYYASGEWRGRWETEGGGVMINQALHTLDLLQWICGMPTHVTAHISNDHLKDAIEVEDTAAARFTCADGSVFHIFATTGAGASFPAHLRFSLKDKRCLHAETNLLTLGGTSLEREDSTAFSGKAVWGTGHKALIHDFYRCIQESLPFPIDTREGSKVVRLILSMYASKGENLEILELD